jgi:hypothetical protein
MKAQILMDKGKVKLVLIPEVSDDMEILALQKISKGEIECTFIENQISILQEPVQNVLVIEPKVRNIS